MTASPDTADDPGVLVVSLVPGFDEGSTVSDYTVTVTDLSNPEDPSNGLTVDSSDTPITVAGLTSGDSYSFTVTATNGDGTSSPSSASGGATSP